MKSILSALFLLCSLCAWAQKDTVPPPPIDIEKLPSNNGSLTRVENQPQFPGGDEALVAYLKENLRYPDDMRQAHVEGSAQVAFTITPEGEVQDVHLQRGIAGGGALNEEALRVVRAMPRWTPARVNGVPIPMVYVLPVSFGVSALPQ
ncbi:MAG: energy transducer TonB [Flavobacteriales bacterium]